MAALQVFKAQKAQTQQILKADKSPIADKVLTCIIGELKIKSLSKSSRVIRFLPFRI